jgi:hypothetical protein
MVAIIQFAITFGAVVGGGLFDMSGYRGHSDGTFRMTPGPALGRKLATKACPGNAVERHLIQKVPYRM